MLKYAREYLQKRFEKVKDELKMRRIFQNEYPILKARFQEGRKYINAYKAQDRAKNNLVGDGLLYFILTLLLGIVIAISLKPLTIPFFIGMSILLGFDAVRLGISVRKFNKAKREFNEVKSSNTLFLEEELKNIEEFERDLYSQTEKKMALNDIILLNHLTREADVLWDILSSDDFVTSIIRQHKNTGEVARALYKEWEAYLDEITSYRVPDNNTILNSSLLASPVCSDSYKEATKKYLIKKKMLENKSHHPLSTY